MQAPEENIRKFEDTIEFVPRRIYAGNLQLTFSFDEKLTGILLTVNAAMVDKLDESVGAVIEALQLAGMLDNSIIVFTSDNGGAPEGFGGNYGSNWPLRGVGIPYCIKIE